MKIVYLFAIALLVSACATIPELEQNQTTNLTDDFFTPIPSEPIELPRPTEPALNQTPQEYIPTFDEGELIEIAKENIIDPDGDELTITFTEPFNQTGQWQTQVGDAGTYTVTITASDGVLSTTRTVTFRVNPVNLPPQITVPETITVQEGERVSLRPQVFDPDGDQVQVTYSGWISTDTYQTQFGDAGNHTVTITATDGFHTVQENVTIQVLRVNRPPVLQVPETIIVDEGDIAIIEATAVDPDGDQVNISFGSPFNQTGFWQTQRGDAGRYRVQVSATDGENIVTQPVVVEVAAVNLPPVIEARDVFARENETVVLDYNVTDPDGDEVTVTISGWMDSDTKQTTFGDAGNHSVTITASDGQLSAEQTITVHVEQVNRPPQFVGDIFR
ncbi:MAG: Ig-like domain-containing protein [Candidatus Woesearchaeota archaeon]